MTVFFSVFSTLFINMGKECPLLCCLDVYISEGTYIFKFLNFCFNQAEHCFNVLEEVYK